MNRPCPSLLAATIEPKNVQQRYNLPTTVRFCTKCTMSNQRPRITFDKEGVCSACRFAEIKRQTDRAERERELRDLCDRFRRNDGRFDVIVPASGGKDSAFVAHQLKYKYNMNPLTVTWAPHLYTDIGYKNFQNFIHKGGFHNICGTADGRIHRILTALAFIHLGDPFQPFIYGQKAFPLRIATQLDIPFIMYGEDGEAEYGGSIAKPRPSHNLEDDLKRHYFSGIGPDRWREFGLSEQDLHFYMPPPLEQMQKVGVQCHFFGYYKKWIPQENYYYAVEHTGFTANPERSEGTYSKYASLDDRLDGFHYYLMYIKFGIGRATSDTAHEIRDGHLTREEGVQLVRKYDGEFPRKYFQDFLEYCNITEEFFHAVVDSWRSPHLWEKKNGAWRLRHTVWNT